MNPELTHGDPIAPPADTNIEYVSNSYERQPPIISAVFRSIFVETPKEVFNSVKNFFQRYTTLFSDSYKYLNSPSLKIKPFSNKDYKATCQHTFELIILVTSLIIFMIKLDWIPSNAKQKEGYNNDLIQTSFQFIFFFVYAIVYFILIVLSVLSARIFRYLFKIPVTPREIDILFTYLTNSLFIITLIVTFCMRCFIMADSVKDSGTFSSLVFLFYIVGFGVLIWRWAKQFVILNDVPLGRRLAFRIIITLLGSVCLGMISAMINFLLVGI